MSKILKFRVWDGMQHKHIADGQGLYINEICEIPPNCEQIYQEFIGLKDIKGKDIFEFDIIKQPKVTNFYKPAETEELLVIGFSKMQCGFRGFRNSKLIGAGNLIKEDCEIIGNIFENSEILQEKI